MITKQDNCFILDTRYTTYAFRVTESGHLEHLYYGKRIKIHDINMLVEKREFVPGNNNVYSDQYKNVTLNDLNLEASFEGKSDNREPLIKVLHSDGSRTSDFVYKTCVIRKGKTPLEGLPSSYDEEERETLEIILEDKEYGIRLILTYYVFDDENVITRTSRVENKSDNAIYVIQLMSAQLGFSDHNYIMSTFNGAWAREMYRHDTPLRAGKHINSSNVGVSSSTANPFFMISHESTTEDSGDVYGMNLVYSGNHAEIAEVSEFGKLRVSWGINPQGLAWKLEKDEAFQSPEAVMTFSAAGYNGMSQNMHSFIRKHIVRGVWRDRPRPILLNSWEAAYFKISERRLLNLAKEGSAVGIELFVMDDGWFGERDSDEKALGDWYPNKKKLPNGLKGLADKINEMGMSFGIWVEPEMVSVDSDLYRKHPEWAMEIPGVKHSEGRNQRILDLCRTEVQDYIIESMTQVFSSANIEYVKWDMNRTFTDIYSSSLDEDRQGEVCHRYVLGLYRCMDELTKKFPDILFEGCASGGNRFDLGILSYFPQIWGSDNTDAIVRSEIQTGYSYGYPLNTVSAHVSSVPNHQTLRVTPLETRFAVASFGSLGYECNLCDMSKTEKEDIKAQIEMYKKVRSIYQFGMFYRGRFGNITEWTVVSEDKCHAIGILLQKMVTPNNQFQYFMPKGLDENMLYHFTNRELKLSIMMFGDLVNAVSPVHVKQDSLMHKTIDRFYKLSTEKEDITAYGDALMYAGVKLHQAFSGTGFNENTRVFSDYVARLYLINAVE